MTSYYLKNLLQINMADFRFTNDFSPMSWDYSHEAPALVHFIVIYLFLYGEDKMYI